jgi:hypothetical protein
MTRAQMDWNTLEDSNEEVRWTVKPDSLPDSYWRETRAILDHLRRGVQVAGIQHPDGLHDPLPRPIIRELPPPTRFERRQPRVQRPSGIPLGEGRVSLQRRFHELMRLTPDDYLQIMQQSRAHTRV